MKKTKKDEAQEDLQRYYKLLPRCESFEEREFFYNGIVSIDRIKVDPNNLRHRIEDSPYNHSEICRFCCVDRECVDNLLRGEIPTLVELKRLTIGMDYFE